MTTRTGCQGNAFAPLPSSGSNGAWEDYCQTVLKHLKALKTAKGRPLEHSSRLARRTRSLKDGVQYRFMIYGQSLVAEGIELRAATTTTTVRVTNKDDKSKSQARFHRKHCFHRKH